MKKNISLFLAFAAGLALNTAALAHDESTKGSASAATSATQTAAAYPLDTCVVSGDKLGGEMGKPVDYIYKEAGKPDRLVRFCCKDCIKDFKKDPQQYLKKIDEAAVAKTKTEPARKP